MEESPRLLHICIYLSLNACALHIAIKYTYIVTKVNTYLAFFTNCYPHSLMDSDLFSPPYKFSLGVIRSLLGLSGHTWDQITSRQHA